MKPITWNGLTAPYTEAEELVMRGLTNLGARNELTFIHELKATLDAHLVETLDSRTHTTTIRREQRKKRQVAV